LTTFLFGFLQYRIAKTNQAIRLDARAPTRERI